MPTEAESTQKFKSVVEDAALDELSKLEAERGTLVERLRVLNDQIREVRGVLRVVRPTQKPTRASANGKHAAPPFKMSDDRFTAAMEWVKERGEEEFVASDLEKALGWSSSYATQSVHQLRDAGVIRLVRKQGQRLIYRGTV